VEVVWGKSCGGFDDVNSLSCEDEVLEALATLEVERFVRVMGAYDRSVVGKILEGRMGVECEKWRGFEWC
jgi:hypothetical protein